MAHFASACSRQARQAQTDILMMDVLDLRNMYDTRSWWTTAANDGQHITVSQSVAEYLVDRASEYVYFDSTVPVFDAKATPRLDGLVDLHIYAR